MPTSACDPCIEKLEEVRSLKETIGLVQRQFQELLEAEKEIIMPEDIIEETETDAEVIEISGDSNAEYEVAIEEEDEDHVQMEEQEVMRRLKLLICHLCQVDCATFDNLEQHFEQTHNLPASIVCCNRKFDEGTAHDHIRDHLNKFGQSESEADIVQDESQHFEQQTDRKEHDSKGFPCETCGRLFKQKSNLKIHEKTHIPLEQRDLSHICQMCDKAFAFYRNLKQHLKTHEKTMSEACPICGKHVFDVKRHERTVHQDRKKHRCHICGALVARLGHHIRMIHVESDTTHSCEECGKEFGSKRSLERHFLSHLGVKVACPFCPHEASLKSNLLVHVKSRHPDQYEEYRAQKASVPKFKVTRETAS